MTVKIQTNGEKVKVFSPYNPDFPSKARGLGGKWNGSEKAWAFDIRDEERVRELCKAIYGYDGNGGEVDTVAVRIRLDGWMTLKNPYWRFGRQICRRPGRDRDVALGAGVVVVDGSFPVSGGSAKYPALFGSNSDRFAILEVRDIPRSMVEEDGDEDIEIVEEKTISDDAKAAQMTAQLVALVGQEQAQELIKEASNG